MATITTITLNVALAIGGTELFNPIERFANEATCNEYTNFVHYNFFYSYPDWGNKWTSGEDCQFHQVHTKCHLCDYMPPRNHAGIGDIYLLHNGVSDTEQLICTGFASKRGKLIPIREWKQVTPSRNRMILLCPNHVGSHFKWRGKSATKHGQLSLF